MATETTDREIGEKIIVALSDAYLDADLQEGIGHLFGLDTETEKDRVCRAVALAARTALMPLRPVTKTTSYCHEASAVSVSRCPGCNMNWWMFPPVHIHGLPMVRCIECKRVYSEDGSVQDVE